MTRDELVQRLTSAAAGLETVALTITEDDARDWRIREGLDALEKGLREIIVYSQRNHANNGA